ncbi:MAG: LysR family transcriptional regulator [Clostridia bacterium]|nr:LysR family transcriptional regulator [Clostridia bacterium]
METNYIPEFLALAEYGSSYLAAEKLFVSQSTLLRHVQSIEDEFGMPLFERSRKGFILNAEGQIFLPYARQIASLKNRCYGMLHKGDERNDVIRVFADGKIIDLLMDFHRAYPDYTIDYYGQQEDVEEALFDGEVDVAFLTNVSPRFRAVFQEIHYAQEEVLALLYDTHPLAEQESITLEQLREEKQIMLVNEVTGRERFSQQIFSPSWMQNVVASVPAGSDVIRMVREKMGISVIHGRYDTVPPAPGLKVLPLNPRIEYELNIYFRNDMPLSKGAETFVNFARRWVANHQEVNQSLIE